MSAPDVLRRWVEEATPPPWGRSEPEDYLVTYTDEQRTADLRLAFKAPEMAALLADMAARLNVVESYLWNAPLEGALDIAADVSGWRRRLDALVEEGS